MRGLTIVVATADEARFRSALGMALAQVATGGTARLLLDTLAVPLVRRPIIGALDAMHAAIGFPGLAGLVTEALDAGVGVTVCQAGVAMAGATVADFDSRLGFGGMVGLLIALGEDRLVIA